MTDSDAFRLTGPHGDRIGDLAMPADEPVYSDEMRAEVQVEASAYMRKHFKGPTTQITVRLPDDYVSFLDRMISMGRYVSRASAVTQMIRREQRRQRADADAEIYAKLQRERSSEDRDDDAQWNSWSKANTSRLWADLD